MDKKAADDGGMVIVEASIVFPVMFLVIFLMIFLGNAYLQKCRVEAIAGELAMEGAAYCASPILYEMKTGGGIPGFKDIKVRPYRYFLGGMDEVENWVEGQLETRMSGLDTGFFSGMRPHSWIKTVKFDNKFLYSSFRVDLSYKVTIPVRLLGASDFFQYTVTAHSEAAVSDTMDFIRNVDMVEDYLESTGVMENIKKAAEKVKEWL